VCTVLHIGICFVLSAETSYRLAYLRQRQIISINVKNVQKKLVEAATSNEQIEK
jgi:hypothetical protein